MNNEKNQKNAKNKGQAESKQGKSGVSNKMPAGTPYSVTEDPKRGASTTTDPAVPNRAHTEME